MDTRSTRRQGLVESEGDGNRVEEGDDRASNQPVTVDQLNALWEDQRSSIMADMEAQRAACLADMEAQRAASLADMTQMFQDMLSQFMPNLPNQANQSSQEHQPRSVEETKLGKLKPGKYDGGSEWESYFRQFEMIARHNAWDESSKASSLAAALSGTALEQPKEDLRAFHQSIHDLARKAWPSAARIGAIEDVVVFHFMRGIKDVNLRDKVMSAGPKTMEEALDAALRLEAVQQLTHPQVVSRRIVRDDETTGEDGELAMNARYPVARTTEKLRPRSDHPVGPWHPRCWRCNTIGHLARDCPHPPVRVPAHLALPTSREAETNQGRINRGKSDQQAICAPSSPRCGNSSFL
ncbi:hypothetical protein GE061_018608 [Apolygus lucorum]|uniref:Uncharacterized protein n=1 Tax=Apolygus lucorum TaxID=248454 RepID=A0A6A4J4L1_APOLU|nr:hypothetical protein GE061_018608 [Apolygus lucorum]